MEKRMTDREQSTGSAYFQQLCMNFCIAFTLFMLFSMAAGMIFADDQAKGGIAYCWMIAGAMLIACLLQIVFFTPLVFRSMAYGPRIGLFGLSLYLILSLFAIGFDWFPADSIGAWVSFTVIYLIILAIMTVLFTGLYRRKAKRLNDSLQKYKETLS